MLPPTMQAELRLIEGEKERQLPIDNATDCFRISLHDAAQALHFAMQCSAELVSEAAVASVKNYNQIISM